MASSNSNSSAVVVVSVDDPFVDVIDQKTEKEIKDEMYRREERRDLDGLERMLIAIDAKPKKQSEEDDNEEYSTSSYVKHLIKRVTKELADMKERASNRVATFTVGLEENLKHDHDLQEFEQRVLKLFIWHYRNCSASYTYAAPYFPMIQCSGTGKTRLLMALRQRAKENTSNSNADDSRNADGDELVDYDCKTILCADAMMTDFENRDLYYDETLALVQFDNMTNNHISNLWAGIRHQLLLLICKKSTKKHVVLLFDEAQFLLHDDGNFFRKIRWWLREERSEKKVVAVFAGTTLKLANVYDDYPPTGFSRDPITRYANWTDRKKGPTKVYDPFICIHTMGCYNKDCPPDDDSSLLSDFERAAYFGRPKFAYLQTKNELVAANDAIVNEGGNVVIASTNLHAIVKRLLVSEMDWKDNETALFSILGSRVQMGVITSFEVVSELVSQAYAHLIHFYPDEGGNNTNARACAAFMSDPVCAALAMGMMHETWTVTSTKGGEPLTGEKKSFWSKQAMNLLTSSLCVPETGNTSEIMAALYMLFCGDALRYSQDKTLRSFSVPLLAWYCRMRDPNQEHQLKSASSGTVHSMDINFIQVCRNPFQTYSWTTQKALAWMYKSALASYVSGCEAMDIVAAARVLRDGKPLYHPILVKCCMQASMAEVSEAFQEMKDLLKKVREEDKSETCPPALCLLVQVGASQEQAKTPSDTNDSINSEELDKFPDEDTFRMISVPADDCYGIAHAVREGTKRQEMIEISCSHAFVYGEDNVDPVQVLRKRKEPDEVTESVKGLFNSLLSKSK